MIDVWFLVIKFARQTGQLNMWDYSMDMRAGFLFL